MRLRRLSLLRHAADYGADSSQAQSFGSEESRCEGAGQSAREGVPARTATRKPPPVWQSGLVVPWLLAPEGFAGRQQEARHSARDLLKRPWPRRQPTAPAPGLVG